MQPPPQPRFIARFGLTACFELILLLLDIARRFTHLRPATTLSFHVDDLDTTTEEGTDFRVIKAAQTGASMPSGRLRIPVMV